MSLKICASKEGPLECVVYMTCQNSVTIEMRVTGTVVYPQVRKRKRVRESLSEGGRREAMVFLSKYHTEVNI